jgi:hypothetical protein
MRTVELGLLTVVTMVACGTSEPPSSTASTATNPPAVVPTSPAAPPPCGAGCEPGTPPPPPPSSAAVAPLRVRFLGVGGFLLEVGDQAVLTAPLYTRPDMVTVSTGLPVTSDAALVEANLPTSMIANVRAILSGHAHYDHLLDVPSVMTRLPQSTLYSNTSSRRLLDAYAPDRAPVCSSTPPPTTAIARSRVVALDDPAASVVDYTNCPDKRPVGAPLTGTWVKVPDAHVRIYAVCSEHPDQIGPVHFAPGEVDTEQCTPPTRVDAWKEGPTLAYLVDFLDPTTEAPLYRFYYQDAPTNAPIGHVPALVLAEKRVDLALLCVGSSDHVEDAPHATIAALSTRYALGGHWEDFFRPATEPLQPILFLDVAGWTTRAQAAMPAADEPKKMVHNGAAEPARAVLPNPGDTFEILPP